MRTAAASHFLPSQILYAVSMFINPNIHHQYRISCNTPLINQVKSVCMHNSAPVLHCYVTVPVHREMNNTITPPRCVTAAINSTNNIQYGSNSTNAQEHRMVNIEP